MMESEETVKQGCVVSDLHLFAPWSSAGRQMAAIHDAASQADFFVLNGDIVDFKWSNLGSAEATAKAGIEWLQKLCLQHPHCEFIYVMGNHDCHVRFAEALDAVKPQLQNFQWHGAFFAMGASLFMHGDLLKESAPFTRKTFRRDAPRPRILRLGYLAAIRMGAQGMVSRLNSRARWAKNTLAAMEKADRARLDGITDIYIGHIHRAYTDFAFQGYRFHNSGSAVHGLDCRILKTVQQKRDT